MQFTIGIHDHCDRQEQHEEFSVRTGTAEGLAPYAVMHLGRSVDIFITPDRLQELGHVIQDYLGGLALAKGLENQEVADLLEEAEAEEQRAEAAIEERDALETGADRCPPRE